MARRWLPVVPAGIAACLAVAGCATVPSGGAPLAVKGASTQVQAYVLPEPPPPPTSQWSPEDVLIGFLHASAIYEIDPAAARAYLAPGVHWHPSAVTVVRAPSNSEFSSPRTPNLEAVPVAPAVPEKTISFTGQQIATLSPSGQYQYTPGTPVFSFTLAYINGVWLIDRLPQVRLLTEADFEQVYRPLNLYYFSGMSLPNSSGPSLVPDPVYAPVEGTDTALNTTVATGLVEGLFTDQRSWLSGATTTSFPPKTVLKSLSISDGTATVDLETYQRLQSAQSTAVSDAMAEQIYATLTTASGYSPPVARSVVVNVDGRPAYTGGFARQELVPVVPYGGGPETIYFQTGQGGVAELAPGHAVPKKVLTPEQMGQADITALASSPTGGSRLAVAVRAGNGCTVLLGKPGSKSSAYQNYPLATTGGPCTSLSWDSSGYLWAATAHRIWLLQPGRHPQAIKPPDMPGTNSAGYSILALRMAPDAVRAALLVQSPSGPPKTNSILLAAVEHTGSSASFGPAVTASSGLTDATALAWYNPYYLSVLSVSAGIGTIYEVPLTGGALQSLGSTPPGAESLTTNGTNFAVGSPTDIWTSPASTVTWGHPITGMNPIYPG
jgi:hypothetical protein